MQVTLNLKQWPGLNSSTQNIMSVLLICKSYIHLNRNCRENPVETIFFRRSVAAYPVVSGEIRSKFILIQKTSRLLSASQFINAVIN